MDWNKSAEQINSPLIYEEVRQLLLAAAKQFHAAHDQKISGLSFTAMAVRIMAEDLALLDPAAARDYLAAKGDAERFAAFNRLSRALALARTKPEGLA